MPAITKDTGLGTAYERIALARMLERLGERYRFENVLEGPADGITGIRGLNSVPLARMGASVEVVLPDQDEVDLATEGWKKLGLEGRYTVRRSSELSLDAQPASFDLVWNFNCLPKVSDPERLLDDMCRASRRYVMLLVSNTWNYGFGVHRLHHRAAREEWSHGDVRMMSSGLVSSMLRRRGFTPTERILVDVPWWPDIDSPIEEVAATFLPFLKKLASGSQRLDRYTWTVHDLPYLDAAKFDQLAREMNRLFFIERMRGFPLRVLFAHHRGVLAERTPLGHAGSDHL